MKQIKDKFFIKIGDNKNCKNMMFVLKIFQGTPHNDTYNYIYESL